MKLGNSWITRQLYADVDIDHSLMSGRLQIRNKPPVLDVIGYIVLCVLSLFLFGLMLLGSFHFPVLFIISLFLMFIVLFGLYNENRLIRTCGKDLQTNKKAMVEVLKSRYRTELVIEGDRIVSYQRGATFWKFTLRVIVLFDRNDVFITIARFNQDAVKSVFHEFFSFLQARAILRDFYSLISSSGLDNDARNV